LIILENLKKDIRGRKEKLEAILSVFDRFSKACAENYAPGFKVSVNKRLASYRGKIPVFGVHETQARALRFESAGVSADFV
jgi:hypothetical protein